MVPLGMAVSVGLGAIGRSGRDSLHLNRPAFTPATFINLLFFHLLPGVGLQPHPLHDQTTSLEA